METTIRAIETTYNGYRFRSRLEARWAVFLDSFGEPWSYEVEGYELPSGRYLPDFWLPRLNCWLEIKGVEPMTDERSRCEELAHGTGRPVAIASDLPVSAKAYDPSVWKFDQHMATISSERLLSILSCPNRREFVRQGKASHWGRYAFNGLEVYCYDSNECGGGDQWWDCFLAIDENSKLCFCSNTKERDFLSPSSYDSFPGMKLLGEIDRPIVECEANMAKAARFEFQR